MKHFICLLLSLFMLAPLVYAQSARQYYDKALKTEDINERIKLLSKAIDKSPKFTNAYHHRADAYKEKGLFKKALADYNKIITLSPKDPFKYYARGLAYMQRNDCDSAIRDFSEAIKLKSNYDDFYYNRAQCYMTLEKYSPALKDLEKIKNRKSKEHTIEIMEGRANFFLLPTRYEIFGMVLLEAMYFGLPALSSRNGGSSVLIRDGVDGCILPEFDPAAYAGKILELAGDPQRQIQMGEAAHQRIEKEFLWDGIAAEMLGQYDLLVKSSET